MHTNNSFQNLENPQLNLSPTSEPRTSRVKHVIFFSWNRSIHLSCLANRIVAKTAFVSYLRPDLTVLL